MMQTKGRRPGNTTVCRTLQIWQQLRMVGEVRKSIQKWSTGQPTTSKMKRFETSWDEPSRTTMVRMAKEMVVLLNEVHATMAESGDQVTKDRMKAVIRSHEVKAVKVAEMMLDNLNTVDQETIQATKELLMALAVRQIKVKLFHDPDKYEGKAYNLITDVLGERAAMDVEKEVKKVRPNQAKCFMADLEDWTNTYRGGEKEKKKTKPKTSMKKKDKGGRGPRARSKYTPVVARKQATRSDHFRKKWITAYQAQTSGDSGTATPEQG